MNNPLTKEELQQMVKDAGKPVVVWLDCPIKKENSDWAMFDGSAFLGARGNFEYLVCYRACGYDAYKDKPRELPTLNADEQAMLRHICKVLPWARCISRTATALWIMDGKTNMWELPAVFFKTIPKYTGWEILIGEDGSVTLEEAEAK